jgi:hypothetical protein
MRYLKGAPAVIETPCCVFRDSHVFHESLEVLAHAVRIAKVKYGWKYLVVHDELAEPVWKVFLAEEDLTQDQVAQMEQQQGPTYELRSIVQEVLTSMGTR